MLVKDFADNSFLVRSFGFELDLALIISETFFKWYFLIVGGLFIINLIYKVIRFIKHDGEDWQLHLALVILDVQAKTFKKWIN
jgi:tellurite resistance protein TehA-like permease